MKAKVRKYSAYLGFLGPAFVAAIAYVDPGNFATNFSAGATYGYTLIWVLVLANVMAALVQYLSAKAGLVTGKSLPQLVRDQLAGPARVCYWLQAEVIAIATDLAEVLGGAIALTLLFGFPLLLSGIITGIISLLLLAIQTRHGQKPFERLITFFLFAIGASIFISLFYTHVSVPAAVAGILPRIPGRSSILLITGMFGATIMPHVVYLHSALARDRYGKPENPETLKTLLRATRVDVAIAMCCAGAINIAMLLFAASALGGTKGVDTLIGAHMVIAQALGGGVAALFAIGLLISGLASTSVGSYAGTVIMEGLLQVRIPLLLRRIVTILPALLLLALRIEPTSILVGSQVVLSFGISFAVIPLILITKSSRIMGAEANSRFVNWCAYIVTGVTILFNLALLGATFFA